MGAENLTPTGFRSVDWYSQSLYRAILALLHGITSHNKKIVGCVKTSKVGCILYTVQ
jgi:hypothetical protein